jgi:uncharacterized membrane protein
MDELVSLIRWMFIRMIVGWALVVIGLAVVLPLLCRVALSGRRRRNTKTGLGKAA